MINIHLGGWDIELHGSGVIWIEKLRLLCIADIHLGKGSFFHQFGAMLPPYDSHETLDKLQRIIHNFHPDIFIALGDSFHDRKAIDRMDPVHKKMLNDMILPIQKWIWVTGNHDPFISKEILGERVSEIGFGDLMFRHQLETNGLAEVSGHYHPKTSVTVKGRKITSPCFVQHHQKLILPSFGSFTGGLDVNNPEFLKVMPAKDRCIYLIHKEQVYSL
jgi:DNA ligase-associated metallophosphoesterase